MPRTSTESRSGLDPYQAKLEEIMSHGYSLEEALKQISGDEYEVFYQRSLENDLTIN